MNTPYVFKKCKKCGKWLVASEINFYKHKECKYGLMGQCKECRRDYDKKRCRSNIKPHSKSNIKPHEEECPDGYKKCSKCGRILEANTDNFYKSKSGKYGVNGTCRECRRIYNRKYDKGRKEQRRENQRKHREYYKKYHEEHKEYYVEYHKKYNKTPQGQVVIFNGHNKRRQRTEQQGDGVTKEQWLEMMKFFGFKCAYSGITLNVDTRSIDHIVPLAKGGAHEVWNCVPMDRSLNSSKCDKDIKEWYPQQDFYNQDKLNKINEWCKYAYNKWGKEVNTKAI